MGIFVLIVVGLVVAQTWLDWRDTRKTWVIPEWAKGVALAGVIAVSLTSVASFASAWIEDPTGQWTDSFRSRFFWPELAFLAGMLGILVFGVRKKKLRLALLLAGCLFAVCWLGVAMFS